MKPQILMHAKSAALTFSATLGVELYLAMDAAESWDELTPLPLVSAITFTAARSALKVLLTK